MHTIHTTDEASIFIIGSEVSERLSMHWHDHKAGYCKVCFIVLQHNIGSLLAAIMTGICWREICLFLLFVKCGWICVKTQICTSFPVTVGHKRTRFSVSKVLLEF